MKTAQFRVVIAALMIALSFQTLFAQAANISEKEKLRKLLVKIMQGDNNNVKVKLKSGVRVIGSVTAVDVDTFTVYDQKAFAPRTIGYHDVKSAKQISDFKIKDSLWVLGIGVMVMMIVRGPN